MDSIEIEIINWGKHQRKDVKKPSWFALDNRILEDSKLFGLSDAEWKALLYVFCQASQQHNSNTVRLNFQHAKRICEISEKTLRSMLDKLEHAGVTRTLRERHADVTPQDRTGQDTTGQDSCAAVPAIAPVNDLELNRKIWESYSEAYFTRYKTEPVRNASVNSKIKQVGQRLGDEAPDVAAFYVFHNKQFYVSNLHPVGMLLADCEALRTQWATGQTVTQRQAQQTDDAASISAQLQRLKAK